MEKITDVVLVAAGQSTRMGCPKIWLNLGELPVLAHSLCLFDAMPEVGRIVVVSRTEDIPRILTLAKEQGIAHPLTVVEGGSTRQQSVTAGIHSLLDSRAPLIAVHDGARPLVTARLVRRVLDAAQTYGAAAPAIMLKDTVKQVDDFGFVCATPNRQSLRAVQTPQIFDGNLYRRALQAASDARLDYTDDCQLVEACGTRVKLVDGEERNIKITTPSDMTLARLWIEEDNV